MVARRTFAEILITIRDYSHWSSIHGLRHIVKSGTSLRDRLFWLVLVVSCTILGSTMVLREWIAYTQVPTETVLTDSALSLEDIPFPTVTICPTHKMNRVVALKLLRQYLDEAINGSIADAGFVSFDQTRLNDTDLYKLIKNLHMMSSSMLHIAINGLTEMGDVLAAFETLRVSEFMRKVMPHCEDVFDSCFWKGQPFTCCQWFEMIETENGLCFSMETKGLHDLMRMNNRPCWATEVNTSGPFSGLSIFLSSRQNYSSMVESNLYDNIASLSVNNVEDRTNMMAEQSVLRIPGGKFAVALQYTLTEPTEEVQTLPIQQRQCLFPSEWPSGIKTWVDNSNDGKRPGYSIRMCYHYCRLKYIFKKCGCLPYPFFSAGGAIECSLSQQASCLSGVSEWLWFYSPPANVPGFRPWEYHMGLNCSYCLPTCRSSEYFTVPSISTYSSGLPRILVDVYFEATNAATLYTILPSMTISKFLVTMGGIGSLFLGISCLSALEIVILSVKCLWILLKS